MRLWMDYPVVDVQCIKLSVLDIRKYTILATLLCVAQTKQVASFVQYYGSHLGLVEVQTWVATRSKLVL